MENEKNTKAEDLYKVPEGYFDQLQANILAKTAAKTANKPKGKQAFIAIKTPLLAVACAFALLLAIGVFIQDQAEELPTSNALLAEVEAATIQEYLYMEGITGEEILLLQEGEVGLPLNEEQPLEEQLKAQGIDVTDIEIYL